MTVRVLIVEDNTEMRELLRKTIEPLAEIVGECEDGAGVVSVYRELRPDWVLMDIEMPHVDGITATRQITAEDPQARVVIVSSYSDEFLRQAAREAGARRYILKENLFEVLDILQFDETEID